MSSFSSRGSTKCPDCGTDVYSMGAHRGKRTCQAWAAARVMKRRGFIRLYDLLVRGAAIPSFIRFKQTAPTRYKSNGGHSSIMQEWWIPKWVGALLLGHWTPALIAQVGDDKDLQIAFTLEYDILQKGPT